MNMNDFFVGLALLILGCALWWGSGVVHSLWIQKLTPWGRLSEKYPLHSEFMGKWLNWQFMMFSPTWRWWRWFRYPVSIGCGKEFLYLEISPKFLYPLAKSIQIPWAAVRSINNTNLSFWGNYCTFVIEDAPDVMIRTNGALSDYLVQTGLWHIID